MGTTNQMQTHKLITSYKSYFSFEIKSSRIDYITGLTNAQQRYKFLNEVSDFPSNSIPHSVPRVVDLLSTHTQLYAQWGADAFSSLFILDVTA